MVNLVSAALPSNPPQRPKGANKKTGRSKARWMQEIVAAHLRHVGRVCPAGEHQEVVLLIDNTPWHAGEPVGEVLAAPRA